MEEAVHPLEGRDGTPKEAAESEEEEEMVTPRLHLPAGKEEEEEEEVAHKTVELPAGETVLLAGGVPRREREDRLEEAAVVPWVLVRVVWEVHAGAPRAVAFLWVSGYQEALRGGWGEGGLERNKVDLRGNHSGQVRDRGVSREGWGVSWAREGRRVRVKEEEGWGRWGLRRRRRLHRVASGWIGAWARLRREEVGWRRRGCNGHSSSSRGSRGMSRPSRSSDLRRRGHHRPGMCWGLVGVIMDTVVCTTDGGKEEGRRKGRWAMRVMCRLRPRRRRRGRLGMGRGRTGFPWGKEGMVHGRVGPRGGCCCRAGISFWRRR